MTFTKWKKQVREDFRLRNIFAMDDGTSQSHFSVDSRPIVDTLNDLQNQCIANHQVNEALRESMCGLTQQVQQNHLLLQQVLELLKFPSPSRGARGPRGSIATSPTLLESPHQAVPAPTMSFEILNSTQDTSSPSKVFLIWFNYNLPGAFQGEKSSTKESTDFCQYKMLVCVYLKYGCLPAGISYPGMMPASSKAIDKWAADLNTIIKAAETILSDKVKDGKISKKAIYRIHDSKDFQTRPYPPNCPDDLTDIHEEMSKRGSKKRKVLEDEVRL